MDHYESLNSALEAFRHFLSNSKLIPKQKINQYDIFLKSLKKLAGLKQKEDEFGIKKFIPELISKNNFHNKSWIIEKSEMLVKLYNSEKHN